MVSADQLTSYMEVHASRISHHRHRVLVFSQYGRVQYTFSGYLDHQLYCTYRYLHVQQFPTFFHRVHENMRHQPILNCHIRFLLLLLDISSPIAAPRPPTTTYRQYHAIKAPLRGNLFSDTCRSIKRVRYAACSLYPRKERKQKLPHTHTLPRNQPVLCMVRAMPECVI